MTTGMMTSFSLPGLPSPFNFLIPPASCGEGSAEAADDRGTAAESPKTDSTEAIRKAKLLRLEFEFMESLPSIGVQDRNQGNAKLNKLLPAAIATYCFPSTA